MIPVRCPGPGTVVTVVGCARSGVAAARWLLGLGCIVRVTESSDTPLLKAVAKQLKTEGMLVEIGTHTKRFVKGSQLLVTSPGVPMTAASVQWACEEGIPCVGEMELGSWYCSGRIVAVTGSNGKSTVVTLLGEILQAAGKEVVVCGNIGRPLCGVLDQIHPSTIVVLEVSSFQLEATLSFHSEIATILNLSENHLDRHRSFAEYRLAKSNLFSYQKSKSWAVLNADDPSTDCFKKSVRGHTVFFSRTREVVGASAIGDWLHVTLPSLSGPMCRRDELFQRGAHHEENALAASCMAGLLGVELKTIGQVVRSFRGLPHRQERVTTLRGVTFINDSKSTTVAAGCKAIEAVPAQMILIAGGRDKGSDFRKLRRFSHKLKAVVLIGEDSPTIAKALKGVVSLWKAESLEEAVRMAFGMAEEPDHVVLSPMCTSFDMFRDFEERGERFVETVRCLEKSAGVETPSYPRMSR